MKELGLTLLSLMTLLFFTNNSFATGKEDLPPTVETKNELTEEEIEAQNRQEALGRYQQWPQRRLFPDQPESTAETRAETAADHEQEHLRTYDRYLQRRLFPEQQTLSLEPPTDNGPPALIPGMNPSGGGMPGFDIPQNPLMFMGEPQVSESMWAHPIGGAFSPPVQQTEENNYYLGDPLGLTIALKEALKQALKDNTQDLEKLLKYTPYWTAYQDDELKNCYLILYLAPPKIHLITSA